MPNYVSLSNIIIDDILLSDGTMHIGVLGGAGVHAIAGARVWSDSLGLIGSVGQDFDPMCLEILKDLKIDVSMVLQSQEKTTRAWQIFQPDEERIEIFRDKKNLVNQLSLSTLDLPLSYTQAKGYHIHFSESVDELECSLIKLRSSNSEVKIVLEPSIRELKWQESEFKRILPLVDVFSPNELEAQQITKQKEVITVIKTLLQWGATKVALRRGEKGSLIADGEEIIQEIPAYTKSLVDVTGAGNAYLGGLLVGLCQGLSFPKAALYGVVSASFAIEQFGICKFRDDMKIERDLRLSRVEEIFREIRSNKYK